MQTIDMITRERDTAMKTTVTMRGERDTAMKTTVTMRGERDTAMQTIDRIRRERDTAVQNLSRIRGERDTAVQNHETVRLDLQNAVSEVNRLMAIPNPPAHYPNYTIPPPVEDVYILPHLRYGKFHLTRGCCAQDRSQIETTIDHAMREGFTACAKCA